MPERFETWQRPIEPPGRWERFELFLADVFDGLAFVTCRVRGHPGPLAGTQHYEIDAVVADCARCYRRITLLDGRWWG